LKKRIYILLPLLLIMLIMGVDRVVAEETITIISDSDDNPIGVGCSGSCCGNTGTIYGIGRPVYGLRVTLYKGNISNKISSKRVNFWADDEMLSWVNNHLNNFVFESQENTVLDLKYGKLMDPSNDLVYKDGYFNNVAYNEKIIQNINSSKMYGIYSKMQQVDNKLNKLDYKNITDDKNNYFYVFEPVVALQFTVNGKTIIAIGTIREIYQNSKEAFTIDAWCFDSLAQGAWNTFPYYDNYVINPYVNRNAFGVSLPDIQNFNIETNYKTIMDENIYGNSGLSEAIVIASAYSNPKIPDPKIPDPKIPDPKIPDPLNDCNKRLTNIKNGYNMDGSKNIGKGTDAQTLELFNLYYYIKSKYSGLQYNGLLNYVQDYSNGGSKDISGASCSQLVETVPQSYSCNNGVVGRSFGPEFGYYYDKESKKFEVVGREMYCNVYYQTNFDISKDIVEEGRLLYVDVFKGGSISANFECITYVGVEDESECKSLFSDEYEAPEKLLGELEKTLTGDISFKINNKSINLKQNEDLSDIQKQPIIFSNNKCIRKITGNLGYDLDGIDWYFGEGQLIDEYQYKDKNNKDDYVYIGPGILTSIDDSSEESGNTEVKLVVNGVENIVNCPYKYKPGLFNKDLQYNFNFRLIDSDQPFSGKKGDSTRKIGNNWCLGYYLNSKIQNHIIKDTPFDNILSYTIGKPIINDEDLWLYDVDGDGRITNKDYLWFQRIQLKNDYIKNCESSSLLVKKFIIDSNDSNSSDKPMYSFVLNSTDIKSIKNYNRQVKSYNDNDLLCINEEGSESIYGEQCISKFVTNILNGEPLVSGDNAITKPSSDSYKCYDKRAGANEIKFCSNAE